MYLKVLLSINKYRKEKFDLVYINGTESVFGWYMAKLLKIPFVWHIRGLLRKGDCFVSGQTKKMNDKNGKLIVISNAMMKSIHESFGVDKSQIVLVHNGIDWEDNNLISFQIEKTVSTVLFAAELCALKVIWRPSRRLIYLKITVSITYISMLPVIFARGTASIWS